MVAFLIAVASLSSTLPAQVPAAALEGVWRGWTIQNTQAGNFTVRDGVLRVQGPSGWLRSERQYGNVSVRTQRRFMTPDADSGLFLRASATSTFMRGWPNGYQVQVRVPSTPSPLPPLGGLFRHGTGSGETRFDADADAVRSRFRGIGEWHDVEVDVIGTRLTVRVDGTETTRAEGVAGAPGYIGIQGESGVVEYRAFTISERP